MTRSVLRGQAALTLFLLISGSALPQDTAERTVEERARHLSRMKAVAEQVRVYAVPGKPESEVKLLSEPLLRYTDNTRKNSESSLWIWSSGGRPTAILAVELYTNPPKGPRWLVEIASLSEGRIAAHATDLEWTATKTGLDWIPLKDAEAPADKALRRLAQMRAICRTFTAQETAVVEGRIQLRQLSSPLFRYADERAGIVDGAVFAFANGTNPEVLVVLEAYATTGDKPSWRCACAQMTGGAVAVEQDGKEVWRCEPADPPSVRASYVNCWIKSEEPSK